MEPVRRAITIIKKYLGALTPGHKLVIGLLVVIVVMSLTLVAMWSSASALKELVPTATSEEQQRVLPILESAGIKVDVSNGKIRVPSSSHTRALALIYQAGQQPSDSALVFRNLLKSQNWINSKEQNRQIYKVMLDNYLSELISQFDNVKSAKVFVDAPEQIGIGQAARPPKASITIWTKAGTPLNQATVDAAARTVSGSVAGLEVARIAVTDGAGRPRKVTDDADIQSGTYRENAAALEKQFRDKIYNLVRYIDDVVVEVTATVDVTKTRSQILKNLPPGEGTVSVPKKEDITSQTQSDAANGAEAGVRSNTQADVAKGTGTGSKSEQKQENTEYTVSIGTENKQVDDPGGMPTRLVATVAVPRSYILSILQREEAPAAGADASKPPAAPDAAKVQARFAVEEQNIKKALEPHVKTRAANGQVVDGEVVVTLVSGESSGNGGGGGGGGAGASGVGGGGLGTILAIGGGLIDKAVLGVLAVFAIGMMVLMVRKAGRKIEVPTAEELVGAPPQLQAKDDLVGEADESETAIAGIELGEEQLRSEKIREQVSDLVKSSPDVAAKMLNRWIAVED